MEVFKDTREFCNDHSLRYDKGFSTVGPELFSNFFHSTSKSDWAFGSATVTLGALTRSEWGTILSSKSV
jgi:hypothetical protein